MGLSGGHPIGSGASGLRASGRSAQLRSHSPPNGRVTHTVDSDSSDSSADDGNVVRVGREYQATVPSIATLNPKPAPSDTAEHAVLVWSPNNQVPENELEDFISIAKEKYSYNMEQALGMLCWHKFDIQTAKSDLPNFTPFPDEWSVEDKVLFEQAFQFHDKHFHKIRQMLPEKSIASLVKYYYGWKKTRSRTSLMDRQARKLKEDQKGDASDNGSEGGSDDDMDTKADHVSESRVEGKPRCENCCTTATAQFHHTNKGMLCSACYSYWRRTGTMKSNASKRAAAAAAAGGESGHAAHSSRPVLAKQQKRKPPKGMYVDKADLLQLAHGTPGTGEAILHANDQQIIALKRQVQNNKQMISQMKHKIAQEIGSTDFTAVPEMPPQKYSQKWTKEEELLAVQALRKYGKDFVTIAELIGNKREPDVKAFYANNERRYQLDRVIEQYNADNRDETEENNEPVLPSSQQTAQHPSSSATSSQSSSSSQSKRVRSSTSAAPVAD